MNPAPGFKKYPQHRVATRPSSAHVRILYMGEVIADTREAVELLEDTGEGRKSGPANVAWSYERLAFYPDKVTIEAG